MSRSSSWATRALFTSLVALVASPAAHAQYGGFGGWGGFGGGSAWQAQNRVVFHPATVRSGETAPAMKREELSPDLAADPEALVRAERTVERTAPRPRSASSRRSSPAPRPKMALGDFFDGEGRLGWPPEAPIEGELGTKRNAADAALLAVQEGASAPGGPSPELVVAAREKLLDYGRPALVDAQKNQPKVLADRFHDYLLLLYDAIGPAASPFRPQ